MAYTGTHGTRQTPQGRAIAAAGRCRWGRWRWRWSARRSPTWSGRRPRPLLPDAPSVPITVGGMVFNIPPAAIRFKVQRRAGAQARVDLSFEWPSLEPPDPRKALRPRRRRTSATDMFATIAASDSTLPPIERLKVDLSALSRRQPAYRARRASACKSFRDGSPYQGEDLIFDPASPARFCSDAPVPVGSTPAICLHERRIASADVTLRFPREWLATGAAVADGIDRLIASFRPLPG